MNSCCFSLKIEYNCVIGSRLSLPVKGAWTIDARGKIQKTKEKAGSMARLNLYAKDYVVFDLETTGLSPEKDEIIEISAIKVRNGQVNSIFSTLVNPGRPIPDRATAINGITDEMVLNKPTLKDALKDFLDFAGDDILVGHNIHNFDMNFLCAGALRELHRKVNNDHVDTLFLARNLLPLSKFRLTDIASYFHLETKGAHRALQDCAMNQQCYEEMRKLWEAQAGTNDDKRADCLCPRCGSLLVRRKGKFGEFLGCSSFPGCRYTKNV